MRRESLQEQLVQLDALLAQMCTEVAAGMQHATTALLDSRVRLAERVISADDAVDALRNRIEEVATEALVFHAPVASGLRTVVTAIRSADDIERMGDLAQHVAEAARRRHPGSAVPEEVRPLFAEMGALGVRLALKTAEVIRTRNVLMAVELEREDDAMDELHKHMFAVLMDQDWRHGVAPAVDLTLLARYYERYADHAVSVARHMVFAVTGGTPESLPI
ncbi:phosphate signaling complex protein PhoU [Pseudonocardia bannensis]|uniref:Phosphate-specific transport system accessory protein PhoU n=1 Tax=Pseudonocardia bannensis TaxID=630973 RepID=A0A848DPR9_9PSEU|nr:phosphate signaling complex protein PhoU [Pseudonocardia bannensis]NMH94782.1 phosphate signaling complex protein PhoU [Pseudonocardia bannensis]